MFGSLNVEPAVPQAKETLGNLGASACKVLPYCEPWAITRL